MFAHKRYPLRKYFYVLSIVAGMALFLYKDQHSSKTDLFQFGAGELLLVSCKLGSLSRVDLTVGYSVIVGRCRQGENPTDTQKLRMFKDNGVKETDNTTDLGNAASDRCDS